ncbi:cupin domain-containing protein [Dactylosporangium sp. NPDC000555]|uniref:cupin domain-containing protein n=1 Tax=Dactylosporangium sp. NPDC000555 TaxID=3154260 RepID=UPI0033299696
MAEPGAGPAIGRSRLLTADVARPADIYGVHGAQGLTHWRCLAGRRDLTGDWEAVEWASIPPGGLSGEHRHTRTEELYLILAGEGEFIANGTAHTAYPGRLLLTGVGSVHGLRNVGGSDLDWLVIEMPTPQVAARLRGSAPHGWRDGRNNNMRIGLYDLRETGAVDPGAVFTGPMRTIELLKLRAGDTRQLRAEDAEHTVFVLGGSGRAISGQTTVELVPGSSVTLPLHTWADLTAGPDGLEVFHAEVAVPAEVL